VCGGAGCGKCGGPVSCDEGAVTKSIQAIDLANQSESILVVKKREIETVYNSVSDRFFFCTLFGVSPITKISLTLQKINEVSLKAVPARRDTGVKFHSLPVGKSYANSITKTTHNLNHHPDPNSTHPTNPYY